MKVKMSKTKKILIFSGILITLGLTLTVAGFAMGGGVVGVSIGTDGLQVHRMLSSDSAQSYTEEEIPLDAFTALKLDIDFADITIKEADHYGLYYKVDTSHKITYDIQDNCLNLTQTIPRSIGYANIMLFVTADSFIKNGDTFILYLPKDAKLTSVDGYCDSSDFIASSLRADSFSLELSFGKLSLDALETSDLSLACDSVTIALSDIQSDTMTVTNTFGNVEATDLLIREPADISVESGKLMLKNADFHDLYLKGSFGDITLENLKSAALSIICDSNDISLTGVSCTSLLSKTSFGNLIASQLSAAGQADIALESGKLSLTDSSVGSLIYDGSFGDINCHSFTAKDLTLQIESGGTTFTDLVCDNIDITSSFGDVTISLVEAIPHYGYDLSASFGEIRIEDTKMGSSYNTSLVQPSQDKIIKINSESGKITIKQSK